MNNHNSGLVLSTIIQNQLFGSYEMMILQQCNDTLLGIIMHQYWYTQDVVLLLDC